MPTSFIVALALFGFGILAFFASIVVYMSYPAPSVQGDASAPWVWLIGCWILAAIVASSHYWHFVW